MVNEETPATYMEKSVADEDAIIEEAMRILRNRLKRPDEYFNSPQTTKQYLTAKLGDKDIEHFMVLFMDTQNGLIADEVLHTGTINSCQVAPREIIRKALFHNAASVILAHNHPSGYPEPSEADKNITHDIERACNVMNINLLDHIIVGKATTVSMAERGMI